MIDGKGDFKNLVIIAEEASESRRRGFHRRMLP